MNGEPAIQLTGLTSARDADGAALRRVLAYGVLAGLCPLIPIPFIDDVIIGKLRNRMIRGQLDVAGLEPGPRQVNLITYIEPEIKLLGCLFGVAWMVIKKIFRKVIFLFALKDCVDHASRMVHHGWLVQYALTTGTLGQHTFEAGNDAIKLVRDSVLHASDHLDTRPFNQALKRIFRGSGALMRSSAGALGRMLTAGGAKRREPDSVESALEAIEVRQIGEVERILDEVVHAMGGQRSYLLHLEQAFDETYEKLCGQREREGQNE
jgi:uncharacterized protein (DUF697 family)